ncbi:hypothetical protein [Cupriavidus oxalaticus]|jgi:hypothetical protein|nr:hypothetical protein [Cupriavidus oxalaticus]
MKAIRMVPGAEGGTLEIQDIPTPATCVRHECRIRKAGVNPGTQP